MRPGLIHRRCCGTAERSRWRCSESLGFCSAYGQMRHTRKASFTLKPETGSCYIRMDSASLRTHRENHSGRLHFQYLSTTRGTLELSNLPTSCYERPLLGQAMDPRRDRRTTSLSWS